jgi:hypothetical protein
MSLRFEEIALVLVLSLVLIAPIGWRIFKRRFDLFEPIVLFAAAYGVMFVVRPTAMIVSHDHAFDGPRSSTDVSSTFLKMLVLALVGAIAFMAGNETKLARRLGRTFPRPGDLASRRVAFVAWAAAGLGILGFMVFLASASHRSSLGLILYGRSTQLSREAEGVTFYTWNSFLLLVPAALVLVATGLERRRKILVVGGLALGALFMVRSVPIGARVAILPLLGGAFVFYYIKRRSRPSAVVLVALAILSLFASGFLSDLRGRSTRGENLVQTIERSTRPQRIAAPLFSGPDSEMAPVLAAALTEIPTNLHYTYGRTIFGDLVVRPIPGALWSEKPVPPRDKLIASLWPARQPNGGISPEFSVLLYFFWDFGIPGVVAGMFIFGLGAGALFEFFNTFRNEGAVQVLYSLALWFIVIGLRDSPVDTLVQFIFVVVPAWLAVQMSAKTGVRLAAVASG